MIECLWQEEKIRIDLGVDTMPSREKDVIEVLEEATAYGPRTTEELCERVSKELGLDLLDAVIETTGVLPTQAMPYWAGRRRKDGRMEWGQIAELVPTY